MFASVSLPVSVNTQGTYLNQVFVGMCTPDADAFPRWNGNLKQYKLGFLGADLRPSGRRRQRRHQQPHRVHHRMRSQLLDTGRPPDAYWAFKPQGDCIPPSTLAKDAYANSNFPDGNIVEKGATGLRPARLDEPLDQDVLTGVQPRARR